MASGLKTSWKLIKKSAVQFTEDNLWVEAAGLAYYTIFGLPPMLLIILRSTSLIYSRAIIESSLFGVIKDVIGQQSAQELAQTLQEVGVFEGTWWAITVGIIGLFITSTTVFITIQNSLNKIFRVKPQPKSGIWKLIRDRILSFAFLLALGFILLVSLILDASLSALGNYIALLLPSLSNIFFSTVSILLPLFIIALLFTGIFRFLPDAYLPWKAIRAGAIVTTLLFSLGKYGISYYVGSSQMVNLYDAAGSVMVIMVWVFYASVIFFFGAVFTKVYADRFTAGIRASDYAVPIKKVERAKTPDER